MPIVKFTFTNFDIFDTGANVDYEMSNIDYDHPKKIQYAMHVTTYSKNFLQIFNQNLHSLKKSNKMLRK